MPGGQEADVLLGPVMLWSFLTAYGRAGAGGDTVHVCFQWKTVSRKWEFEMKS